MKKRTKRFRTDDIVSLKRVDVHYSRVSIIEIARKQARVRTDSGRIEVVDVADLEEYRPPVAYKFKSPAWLKAVSKDVWAAVLPKAKHHNRIREAMTAYYKRR